MAAWRKRRGMVAGAVMLGALAVWRVREPVLAAAPAMGSCACGEWEQLVSATVWWNPWRDRGPEEAAAGFLERARNGRCAAGETLCRGDRARRVRAWRLAYRKDAGEEVTLYFRLSTDATRPMEEAGGAGAMSVLRREGRWEVIGFDAYF